MKKWENFSEEELKKFFEESKTASEFAEKIGYKDRHVAHDIKKTYSWCDFSERNNLLGKRFGKLTVIKKDGTYKRKTRWTAQCDCGNIVHNLATETLKSGHTQSCGCKWIESMHNQAGKTKKGEKICGKKFGRLLVLPDIIYSNGHPYNKCQCDCGNITYVSTGSLTSKTIKSCGCLLKEAIHLTKSANIIGKKFGSLTVIDETDQRKNRSIVYKCQCDCGNLCERTTMGLRENSSCGCKGNSSSTLFLEKILKKEEINYLKEFNFSNLIGDFRPLRFDFAIFNKDNLICLIEYQGEQHYRPVEFFGGEKRFKKQLEYDAKKEKYCEDNNIPLILISYKEANNFNEKLFLEQIRRYMN